MPSLVRVRTKHGERLEEVDMLDYLPPDEGELNQIYGRIGTGKTYLATVDAIELLKRGQIVYTNWNIDWQGYDERDSWWLLLKGVFGLKKVFYYFPKENLHVIRVDSSFIDLLGGLSDCTVMLDEGHLVLDSYTKTSMDMERRNAVLWTRHFDRTIIVISQRPSAIHVTMRANVNRFYKCEKTFDFSAFGRRFIRFVKTEFQDVTSSDTPDEAREINMKTGKEGAYKYAISTKAYWGKVSVFQAYNTKYRRAGSPSSQVNAASVYTLSWKERFYSLFRPYHVPLAKGASAVLESPYAEYHLSEADGDSDNGLDGPVGA